MLKRMTHVAMMLAGILFAVVPLSHATIGLSVSSVTVMNTATPQIPFIFMARKNESVTAIIGSTSPLNIGTTVQFEQSTNMSNWSTLFSTATGTGGFSLGITYVVPPVYQDTFFRFNIVSTGTAQTPFAVTIRDNDDVVSVLKNNKQQDSVYFTDDGVSVLGAIRPDRIQLQTATSTGTNLPIVISSFTQLAWGQTVTGDKAYGLSLNVSTYTQPIDKSFVVLQATGTAAQAGDGTNGIFLSARPTISTQTAVNGDMITFVSNTSSITFQSDSALAGSALKLGASTRALGTGDTLSLIFLNGFWRELSFVNNIE